MVQRDKEIEARAREISAREEPDAQWRPEFVERGASGGKVAIGEGCRQELLQRAERELVAEGRISGKPV